MLYAEGQVAIGSCWLRSRVLLERRFRTFTGDRVGMAFDSDLAAAEAGRKSGYCDLYLVERGRIRIAGGSVHEGPVALILAEDEFMRVKRGASKTFRFDGARCTVVDVRLAQRDVRAPIGLGHGPLPLAAEVWAAVAEVHGGADEVAARAAMVRLLDGLAAAGHVAPDLSGSIVAVESDRVMLLWRSLADRYANLRASTTLDELKSEMGVTLRQLRRDVGEVASTFGLTGDGLKDVIRVLRLRTAVTFLSAPEATLHRVAELCGYAGIDAMDRALRDAGLPRAAEIRARLMAPP